MIMENRNYYLPSEIKGLLLAAGKPKSTFYNLVRVGKIETRDLDGMKVYDKPKVDAFLQGTLQSDGRKKLNTSIFPFPEPLPTLVGQMSELPTEGFTIDRVFSHEDVGAAFTIEAGLLGWGQAIYPSIIEDWLASNDHIYWLFRDAEGRELAVLGILPLEEEMIFRLLRGDISPKDIKSSDILPYRLGFEYNCYVCTAASVSEYSAAIALLLTHVFAYWRDQAHIYMNRLYAVSEVTTDETPMVYLANEYSFSMLSEHSKNDRIAWVLRTDLYNKSHVVKNFIKSQLREKQKERSSMLAILPEESILSEDLPLRVRHTNSDGYFTPNVRFKFADSDDDIRGIVRINRALFPPTSSLTEDSAVNLLRSWWEMNNEIFQILVVNDEIVGYVSLIPLPIQVINGIMSDDIRVSQIPLKDIKTFEPGSPIDFYVWTVGLHPDFQEPLKLKRTLGRYLLQGIISMFSEFGERGIEIRSAWARSDTIDGIGISRGLGFEEVLPTPSKSGKPVFKLDVAWSNKPFLLMYMKALTDYRSHRALRIRA